MTDSTTIALARKFLHSHLAGAARQHAERVGEALHADGYGAEVVAVGLLHDVPAGEDLDRSGLPQAVLQAVWLLTPLAGEGEITYLDRVAQSPLALTVLLYGIVDEIVHGDMGEDGATLRQRARHRKALVYLTGARQTSLSEMSALLLERTAGPHPLAPKPRVPLLDRLRGFFASRK